MRFQTENLLMGIVTVYSRGRCIGHVNQSDIECFLSGDYSKLAPIHNWKLTFSESLIAELGLVRQ